MMQPLIPGSSPSFLPDTTSRVRFAMGLVAGLFSTYANAAEIVPLAIPWPPVTLRQAEVGGADRENTLALRSRATLAITPMTVTQASAEVSVQPAVSAANASTGISGPPIEVYARSSVTLYLATNRTMGGLGGGGGARYFIRPWLFGQADLAVRMMIGRVGELRLGLGAQREGYYCPAVTLFASGLVGDQLSFFLPDVAAPALGPALAVGLELHPIRFRKGGLYASALNFGLGAGLEGPSLPLEVQVGLLEMGSRF